MSTPIYKDRDGSVELATWKNEKDGNVFYTTTFQNNYRDESGDWKTSQSYSPQDLLKLNRMIDKAYDHICNDKAGK